MKAYRFKFEFILHLEPSQAEADEIEAALIAQVEDALPLSVSLEVQGEGEVMS